MSDKLDELENNLVCDISFGIDAGKKNMEYIHGISCKQRDKRLEQLAQPLNKRSDV